MKVYGIINHNNNGGAQKAMEKLKQSFVDNGEVFEIIYLYEATGEGTLNNGFLLTKATTPRLLNLLLIPFMLRSFLVKNRPDAVVCFLPFANIVGALVAKLSGIQKRVVSHRNPTSSYNRFLYYIDKILGSTLIYTDVVCNSKAVKDSLISYSQGYTAKSKVIYNCVQSVSPALSKSEVFKLYGIADNNALLFAVGRLSEQKNYPYLIDSMKYFPSASLIIAGHGPLQHSLQQQIIDLGLSDRVLLVGNLNKQQLAELYASCDLYVQTSLYEGQSNSLLEAISHACVVASNDIPPQREVLTNSKGDLVGHLIDCEAISPSLFGKGLSALINEKNAYEKMQILAKNRSLDFSTQNTFKQFYNLILS